MILLKIRNLIDAKSNSSEKKCERERREGVEGGREGRGREREREGL